VTAHAPIVVTAKNQSPGLSGEVIEAAKARLGNSGIAVTSASRRRRSIDTFLPQEPRIPERCSVQLNQADRLGVYVVRKSTRFSPGLQL